MNTLAENPLKTREDVRKAALALLTPLADRFSHDGASLNLGGTGARHDGRIAGMEAFSRALWGLIPLLIADDADALLLWPKWQRGLIRGVDPEDPGYWGQIDDFDQRMVEMAAIAVGICLAPHYFWHGLPESAQKNLSRWLSQINRHEMTDNNWVFFRILVNIALAQVGGPTDGRRLARDLDAVEAHYEGDGWYFDTEDQRDYYTAWGYHYYGLLYAAAVGERDPLLGERFISRAETFAPQYAAWFSADGEALPYGRSLTYRFAQGSFYAALAFASPVEPSMGWGRVKRLWLQNLRCWLKKPILSDGGVLTIGYAYPNLIMSEAYNAPGSPYWAMKTFLALALPEDHPFWQADEQPFEPPERICQPHARMLIVRDVQGSHVQCFPAGNHAPWLEHADAKYEKFAYSTTFSFSVARSQRSLEQGAFDSMLVLSEDGKGWRPRFGCEDFLVLEDRVLITWKPYEDVTIQTEIVPDGDWHLRRHTIKSGRRLVAAEGGYAIARAENGRIPEHGISGLRAFVHAPWGSSGIIGLSGYNEARLIFPCANTNLLSTRTALPTLLAEIAPGEAQLACLILGSVNGGRAKWRQPPDWGV